MTENEEFIRTGYEKLTYEELIARFNNAVRYPLLGGCPFCGNYDLSVRIVGDARSTAAVTCNECDAEGPTATTTPKAGELWNVRTPKEDMNNKILVMAGLAAVQKWDIDLTKINIKFVDSLEPFFVSSPQRFDMANPPSLYRSRTPVDNMIFQSDNGTRWRKDNIEFWLAWGPVTNTLAIYIRDTDNAT